MKGKDKTNRILGFLVAKGLLIAPGVKPYPTVKLTIPDVLEAAELDEPRILEVLPAALLSFPKSFLHFEALPEELQVIIQHISNRSNYGVLPAFRFSAHTLGVSSLTRLAG